MEFAQIFILSLIQALTEFLPVSSSGHLILLPYVMNWPQQPLVFDVALHVGTLLAIVIYFRQRIVQIATNLLTVAIRRDIGQLSSAGWMGLYIILATIPAVIFGYLIHKYFIDSLRSPVVVAFNSIFWGIVLYICDRMATSHRPLETIQAPQALKFGIAQMLAVIPGTSRSGICLSAGLAMGFSRTQAAEFIFLMSIPSIAGAATLTGLKAMGEISTTPLLPILLGIGLSALFSLAVVAWFMRFLQTNRLTPFVIYRLVLGAIILWTVY